MTKAPTGMFYFVCLVCKAPQNPMKNLFFLFKVISQTWLGAVTLWTKAHVAYNDEKYKLFLKTFQFYTKMCFFVSVPGLRCWT